MSEETIKIVVVVFDNYNATIEVNGKSVEVGLWDTAGQEDYDKIRPLSYPGTSVFLMCYSIENPTSLKNITSKWAPEIAQFQPNTPIILVGTKSDLREDPKRVAELAKSKQHPVTVEEGKKVATEIKAVKHLECSAFLNQNVKEVFNAAIVTHLSPKTVQGKQGAKDKKNCLIL
ncbi:Ras-related protein Rac [Acrasis kona]|uniref:Ras-related protein Rac n=1 Tax=Acrasis kona TaxID=1008807 RepID=A0AAW2ZI49_9EUKA